jgi:head-tail adaptor
MQRKKLQQFLTLKTRNGCCENGKINKIEKWTRLKKMNKNVKYEQNRKNEQNGNFSLKK